MICPVCGEDYSDSFKKMVGTGRKVIGVLEHYGQPFQIKGMYCPACGNTTEFITSPTGNLFHQRREITDPQMLYTNYDYYKFLTEHNLIAEFEKFVEENRPRKEQQ